MAEEIAPRVPASGWYVLIVLFVTAVLSYTDRYILGILVENLRGDLALSDVAISFAQGPGFALVYGGMVLVMGRLADRVVRRNLILAGLVLWSLSTAACGFATGLGGLLLCRFLVGVGEAAFYPAAVAMLGDIFPPQRRGFALGVLLVGVAMGSGMAVIAGAGLLALLPAHLDWPLLPSSAPWRGVLIILGGIGLPIVGLVALMREPERSARSEGGEPGFVQAVRDRLTLVLPPTVAVVLLATADAAATAWTPTFFVRHFRFSNAEIAGILGPLALFAGAAGFLLGGVLGDRLARFRLGAPQAVVAAGGVSLALATLFFPLASAGLALAGYAGFVFAVALANVAAYSAVLNAMPVSMHGRTTAVLAFLLILGGLAAGPSLVALVTDHLFRDSARIGLSIALVCVVALIPAVVLLWWTCLRGRVSVAGPRLGRPPSYAARR